MWEGRVQVGRHFQFDDGGRRAAGYKGKAGDCVVRAISIATGKPYQQIYDLVNSAAMHERTGKRKRGKSDARTGVYKTSIKRVMQALGWVWTPTMQIGSGCTVHLRADELPSGRLVVSVSKHLTAVIDGVIYDTHDPSRRGTRCVLRVLAARRVTDFGTTHREGRELQDPGFHTEPGTLRAFVIGECSRPVFPAVTPRGQFA